MSYVDWRTMAKCKRDNLRGGREPCASGAIAMWNTCTDDMAVNYYEEKKTHEEKAGHFGNVVLLKGRGSLSKWTCR